MINGNIFRDALISGANNITLQKQQINDLNIFPVPDGDTGTNMSMTVSAAAKEIKDMQDQDISAVAAKAASAMLRNARGNSGVITSIIFRGFAKAFAGKQEATGKDLAQALGIGVEDAYKAVTKPTEGTILTVARMAYEEAVHTLESDLDDIYVWSKVIEASKDALALTPKFLPVLKKAGVVDAGGKGLLEIFEGMQAVFSTGEIIELAEEKEEVEVTTENFTTAVSQYDEVINFTYCTEFIVGRSGEAEKTPDELREFLMTIGDCVVVVDDDEIIKVHVHTDTPGVALQSGLEHGQLLTVKVENMREQHKAAGGTEKKEEAEPALKIAEPVDEVGFVSVAAGEGLIELFKDMGCSNVVSGGQSMNPSTDDILEAILATPAKNVIVLPNNKNIVMAAQQAVSMVEDRNVYVIKTKTVTQGMTALINYDEDSSIDENIEVMTKTASKVVTGQVTFAARDSEFGGKKIKEGEIIGLENGRLSVCEKTSLKALLKLCKNIINKHASFVTLIYGNDISEEDAKEAYDILSEKYGKNVDISLVKGDQPIYYYIVGVEY